MCGVSLEEEQKAEDTQQPTLQEKSLNKETVELFLTLDWGEVGVRLQFSALGYS